MKWWALGVVLLSGCGGGGGGGFGSKPASSEEAAIEAFAGALDRGDVAALVAMHSESDAQSIRDCPPDGGKAKMLIPALEKLVRKDLAKLAEQWKGKQLHVASSTERRRELARKGDAYGSCTYRRDVDYAVYDVTYAYGDDGEWPVSVDLMGLDGRWYIETVD